MTHELLTERTTIEPFNLRYKPRQRLVIDRSVRDERGHRDRPQRRSDVVVVLAADA